MRYSEVETNFFEVLTLSNFIRERLSGRRVESGDLSEARSLIELAARLSTLSHQLYVKGNYAETLISAKSVIEIVATLFLLQLKMKVMQAPLARVISDPQITHCLRWIKSGGSQKNKIAYSSHPVVEKAIDYLEEWLGGIRWQYDALVEFSNIMQKDATPGNRALPEENESPIPEEYTMQVISKMLVNFLTIGMVLFDEIVTMSANITERPAYSYPEAGLSNQMRFARAV